MARTDRQRQGCRWRPGALYVGFLATAARTGGRGVAADPDDECAANEIASFFSV